MKIKLIVALLFLMGVSKAQNAPGVKFENELSWAQVQEKAKKENKYIFVDVFTTWCGPCKLMDRDVFPQEKVGEFFNTYFINVKAQADTTEKDSEEVKRWYRDAQAIVSTYNINSYPTYLFYDPMGNLVHRLSGGSPSGEEFIAKAEAALSGHPKLKRQFQAGERDPEFLLKLTKSAQLMNDGEFIPVVTNEYLATQKDLLTEQNLKFISLATRKTTDPGFAVLRNDAGKADQVIGEGESKRIVNTVVFDEVVLPHLRTGGAKNDYGGGMVAYTGKVNEQVNWDEIKKTLDIRFPDLSDEIMMTSKPMYYQWQENWPVYARYISSKKDGIDNQLLDSYANTVFLFSDEPKSLEKALGWSEELATRKDKKNPRYLYTYANLLYKTGKKEEAIKVMGRAVEFAGEEGQFLTEILEKMKSGKETW